MSSTKTFYEIFKKRIINTTPELEVAKTFKLLRHAGLHPSQYPYIEQILTDAIHTKQEYLNLDAITINYDIDFNTLTSELSKLLNKDIRLKLDKKKVLISYDGKNYTKDQSKLSDMLHEVNKKYVALGSNGEKDYGWNYKKFKVSISPYYIMQMSYNKVWTSCTNLNNGCYMGTTIGYAQLPNHLIVYGINPEGKIRSRFHILVDKDNAIHVLRIYGNNIHSLLLRSLIRKLIKDYKWLHIYKVYQGKYNEGNAAYGIYIDPSIIYYLNININTENFNPYYHKEDLLYETLPVCPKCGCNEEYAEHDIVCVDCSPDYDYYCCMCETGINEGDEYWGDNQVYCERCFHEYFTFCSNCGEAIYNDYAYVGADNEVYCEDCFDSRFRVCDICGSTEYIDCVYEVRMDNEINITCSTCVERLLSEVRIDECAKCCVLTDQYVTVYTAEDEIVWCNRCAERHLSRIEHIACRVCSVIILEPDEDTTNCPNCGNYLQW